MTMEKEDDISSRFNIENMKELESIFQRKLYDRMLQWKQEDMARDQDVVMLPVFIVGLI